MEDRERVGIGTVVMRNKQYLTAIRPLDGALAMSTMRFADEVVPRKDIDEIPNRRTKTDAKSLKLTTQIVDSLTAEWQTDQYAAPYPTDTNKRSKANDEEKEAAVEGDAT